MTYWHGFVGGVVGGALITFFATGHIYAVGFTEYVRVIAILALLVVFVASSMVSAYSAKRRCSLFNPTADGVIAGIAFIEGIIIFLLYGLRF